SEGRELGIGVDVDMVRGDLKPEMRPASFPPHLDRLADHDEQPFPARRHRTAIQRSTSEMCAVRRLLPRLDLCPVERLVLLLRPCVVDHDDPKATPLPPLVDDLEEGGVHQLGMVVLGRGEVAQGEPLPRPVVHHDPGLLASLRFRSRRKSHQSSRIVPVTCSAYSSTRSSPGSKPSIWNTPSTSVTHSRTLLANGLVSMVDL